MMSTEELLRLTVSALMQRREERQGTLAEGLGQSQAAVSRKLTGRAHWSLEDVDLLAGHYGMHPLDVLSGPTHAVGVLHGAVPSLRGIFGQPLPAPAPVPVPGAPVVLTLEGTPDESAAAREEDTGPQTAVQRLEAPQPCVLCGQPCVAELDGFPQHLTTEQCAAAVAANTPPAPVPPAPAPAPAAPEPEPVPTAEAPFPPAPAAGPVVPPPAPVAPVPPAPAPAPAAAPPAEARPVVRSAPRYASEPLIERITGRVEDVLDECGGDLAAARDLLVKSAIPDVMDLLKASRVGGRYEHSEFPPTHDILSKKSQKGADEIWEGRPKWRNAVLFEAAKKGTRIQVSALDMNAAYLSALKCWLPIGQLKSDTSGVHDPKRSGVHLITPPAWDHTDLPNPLGNRMEPGQVWVGESTLRLMLDCARQGLADAPVIHESLVSGASEGLLEKMRRAMAEIRKNAIAENDELTVEYVKAMYSKFVSTIGESSKNRELRRPDWMHIIRSKAFANLWMKAHKAQKAGLQVVQISGTDELHVAGDWRSVFPEGRDLNQVKEKHTYILGGKR
ncbi:helix-turn-helix transcriptional regulator [Streptomyces sp. NPDC091278]|uniref:helix-turn-helix domain-containing protein n=1 Tax=Streptomyces sp. NPDC091278 TaxID=3155301 RepID=UPI00344C5DFC